MRQYLQLKTLDIAAPWLLFVAVVWLCWKLAALIWLVVAPPQPPAMREISLQSNQGLSVPNITGFALFKENRTDVSAQPVSDVPLKLEGVFIGRPAHNSAAVIRAADLSNRYRVGQKIEGTSQQLIAVAWDHVILRYADGREAALYFGDQPVSANQNTAPSSTQPALNEGQQAQNAIGDAVRQLQNNPVGYLNQMGVNPTAQGYEVTAAANAELRSKLGLRPGDKIVSLNGRPLGQVQNDVRVLEQVQQQRSAQIEIRRGEQTMTIQQSF
jgi:general secretion pathway protein C